MQSGHFFFYISGERSYGNARVIVKRNTESAFQVMFTPSFFFLLKYKLHILKHPNNKFCLQIHYIHIHIYTYTQQRLTQTHTETNACNTSIHTDTTHILHINIYKNIHTHIATRSRYKAFFAPEQAHLCPLLINNLSLKVITFVTSIIKDQVCLIFSFIYIYIESFRMYPFVSGFFCFLLCL